MTIRPRHYAEFIIDGPNTLVAQRLDTLMGLAGVSRELSSSLKNPSTRDRVKQLLQDLELDQSIRSLVSELVRTGRVQWLPAITRVAEQLLLERGSVSVARISVADPEAIDHEFLESAVREMTGTQPELRIHTDREQLGGIAIRVADQSLDQRLDHRLNRVRASLRERIAA